MPYSVQRPMPALTSTNSKFVIRGPKFGWQIQSVQVKCAFHFAKFGIKVRSGARFHVALAWAYKRGHKQSIGQG